MTEILVALIGAAGLIGAAWLNNRHPPKRGDDRRDDHESGDNSAK